MHSLFKLLYQFINNAVIDRDIISIIQSEPYQLNLKSNILTPYNDIKMIQNKLHYAFLWNFTNKTSQVAICIQHVVKLYQFALVIGCIYIHCHEAYQDLLLARH